MATENTETNAGKDEETSPSSEPNEHDYAHTTATNFTSTEGSSSATPPADVGVTAHGSFTAPAGPEQSALGRPTLSVELPGPTVGAEVDCPGGNEPGAASPPQTEDESKRTTASEFATVSRGGGRRRSMRPEDRNCAGCKTEFERQGRSFRRRAVFTFSTPETVRWVFPDADVHEKSFLCETCAQVIRSKGKRKQSGKRSLWLKPPVREQVGDAPVESVWNILMNSNCFLIEVNQKLYIY